jgi:hypothetical protein
MKKRKRVGDVAVKILLVFTILLLISPNVSAVGLKWYTEAESVISGKEKCIPYGAYNPSNEDIKVVIEVTDELIEIVLDGSTDDKIIPANTRSKEAVEIKFCFQVTEIYPKDCLIAGFLCEQKCGQEPKRYDGDMVMTEKQINQDTGQATGSGTSLAASSQLALIVECHEFDRSWTPAYIVLLVIVLTILALAIRKKYSKPKIEREKEKLKKLRSKIEKEEKGSKKK